MKIAFVVDRFGSRYGGAEAYGVALMRELARGHEITVFARDYDSACDLRLPFVPLRSWSGWPSWIRVLLFAWRAGRCTRKGFDIVHSHMNGWCGDIEVVHVTPVRYNWRVRSLPFLKRALSRVSPRVQTYLGLEHRRVEVRQAHRTVSVSGLIAEQLRQAYGEQLVSPVIPPGVARPASPPPGLRARVRQDLGLSDQDRVCLLVARNPLRKGLPAVLKALALLPERYKALVVGGKAITQDFLRKTDSVGLADRVRLVDTTSEVDCYYLAADLYVHPTLNDSFGMAPLEAMSFGLPVVLSPSPWCGFAQYVKPGEEALVLSHPENAEELASFIAQISDDAALRARLVQGGDQVVARHSWAEVARRYLDLYQEVLRERT
ncbi:glycosyltransferase family 4 protein [Paralcaligenes sp. KSB-10]|uniref:glycosyltransferase family 4 protein n=1 Tax=Paralcaligenes sp. KSB-10 TaxID=2901142 RepID=UPI001E43F939|nr:glycosyltransferase family 4 protein [Paralcaligenes sp. KSB-10]UHL66283.1 glycosyltransferase family 4 protein [Paralcaligenes sp. KSB-10]